MTPPDLASVLDRLEKLERRQHRLRRLALALLLVGAAVWMIGRPSDSQAQLKDKSANIIEAQRFIVRDSNGKMRAALALFNSGPGVAIYDADEKPRAILHLTKDGSGLVLQDAQAKVLAGLESDGKTEARLLLKDTAGHVRVGLTLTKEGQGLDVRDDAGKRRALLGVDNQKGGMLLFYDRNGKTGVTLGMDNKVGPGIELKNDKGKVLFTKP